MKLKLPIVTASGLHRVIECPGSTTLSHTNILTQETLDGVERHRILEEELRNWIAGKGENPVPEILQSPHQVLHIEAAWVWNVHTGAVRFLGEGIGRAYFTTLPGEVPMTLDLVYKDEAGRVSIVDWKSAGRVPAPEKNWQLAAQAAAVMSHYALNDVKISILYLNNREIISGVLDRAGVEGSRHGIKNTIDRIVEGEESRFKLGPWCTYCGGRPSCPERLSVAQRGIDILRGGASLDVTLVDKWFSIKTAIDELMSAKEELDVLLKLQGGGVTSDGQVVSLRETQSSYLDSTEAKRILQENSLQVPMKSRTTQSLVIKK